MKKFTFKTNEHLEFSKKIIKWCGIFIAFQVYGTMTLDCIFPSAANSLNSICLSCIAAYSSYCLTYFGKSYGENKLKISNTINGVLETIQDVSKQQATATETDEVEQPETEG